MTTATVTLWDTAIGYVSMNTNEQFARFEYDPLFVGSGMELAPMMMPLAAGIFRFPELHQRSFYGLPGLLADSLPDKYGHNLIHAWLARTGRNESEFNAVDRLCYVGERAMGALEYHPASGGSEAEDKELQIQELVELASIAFASKSALETRFGEKGDQGLLDILSVGTSAGGARAKAVIAYNEATGSVRSGQMSLPPGFEHWLIKFDGVEFSGDWGIADPAGYGLLEYSYYEIAIACGIEMSECRVISENGRNHFMTRRFDRSPAGAKSFMQTFAALQHFDYYQSQSYSYEQLIMMMRRMNMDMSMIEEQVRRIVFNLVGCNQDDHVKNFSFLMDRNGKWKPSPAYDLCHAEGSDFTRNHQLTLNGKSNHFTLADMKHLESFSGLPRGTVKRMLERTCDQFSAWKARAIELGIQESLRQHVLQTIRLKWS
jgi:serine/threonine-protein kinase HipA